MTFKELTEEVNRLMQEFVTDEHLAKFEGFTIRLIRKPGASNDYVVLFAPEFREWEVKP